MNEQNAFKVIVAGSRSITDHEKVVEAIQEAPFQIEVLVSGGADGVDTIAENWAHENGVPLRPFDVKQEHYDNYGSYAPIRRNENMAEHADALIAVWNGTSSGTKNMIKEAEDKNLEVNKKLVSGATTLDDF